MDELTREFLLESQEGLDRMERCLTDLEERPDDAALIADVFRSVHTIKGTTGFLGFKRLKKLAHAGENLLGLLRDGKLAANEPIITGLLQLLDGLRSILQTIEADGNEGEGSDAEIIVNLGELQSPALARRPTSPRMFTPTPRRFPCLRELVLRISQNVLDPSRDYLFETRLTKLLRNQAWPTCLNSSIASC